MSTLTGFRTAAEFPSANRYETRYFFSTFFRNADLVLLAEGTVISRPKKSTGGWTKLACIYEENENAYFVSDVPCVNLYTFTRDIVLFV